MALPTRDRPVEICATVLVGVAALATSWSGYQATLWNGTQGRDGAVAAAMRECATRAAILGGQQRTIDVMTFVAWLSALSGREPRVASFYERHVRPEFAPTFQAWLAIRRSGDTTAPAVPFTMQQYRLASDTERERCQDEAERAAAASLRANQASDGYVLATVIFAVVLFFGGAIGDARARDVQLTLLGLSVAACLAGLAFLSRLPRGA